MSATWGGVVLKSTRRMPGVFLLYLETVRLPPVFLKDLEARAPVCLYPGKEFLLTDETASV